MENLYAEDIDMKKEDTNIEVWMKGVNDSFQLVLKVNAKLTERIINIENHCKSIESLTARLALLEDLIIDAGLADKLGAN